MIGIIANATSGARMEYNMRNEIFEHYQKLSFSFYDNQKVGQLMSRVTNDLFDISEFNQRQNQSNCCT